MAAKSKKSLQPRITSEILRSAYDEDDIRKHYPFARILPVTYPSAAHIKLDWFFYRQKANLQKMQKAIRQQIVSKDTKSSHPSKSKVHSKRKSVPFDFIKMMRLQELQQTARFQTLKNPDHCRLEKCNLNGVKCEWIIYDGASMDRGVIIVIHGGAYIMGSTGHKYRESEVISKMSGCACLLVDYGLAPEQTVPQIVDQLIAVYDHLVGTLEVSPHRIAMEGESAGGGAILLMIQKLKMTGKVLPCCVWVNSPWTDLSDSLPSKQRNHAVDAMIGYDSKHFVNDLVVGNRDYFGIPTHKNANLKDPQYSPLFGKWNGLCPIYFMVGATECLLDDTLCAAQRAFEEGVEVKVDVDPFMIHAGPVFSHVPEYRAAIVRGCDWILCHFKRFKANL